MKQTGCLIAFLGVSWLTCSAALVQKRKQPVVVNASSGVAGQQPWSPEVHAYIRYLEDLEKSSLNLAQTAIPALSKTLPETRAVPQHAGAGTVLFVVLTDSNHYHNALEWIGETWGQDLPADQLMAIGDEPLGSASTMRVEPTHCPAHTHDGACCKMGEALINAQSEMKSRPRLKWAYIVDDDAYVRPTAMEEQFSSIYTLGMQKHGVILGVPGCGNDRCNGFCGGAGAALSRQALHTLVGASPSSFLTKHMQTCQRCAATNGMLWGDVSVGQQAKERGSNIELAPGLEGWPMNKAQFEASLVPEPLQYHYQKSRAQFIFLHRLFSPSGTDLKNGQDQMLEHGLKNQDECVTFRGNSQCWSQPTMEYDFGENDTFGFPIQRPWTVGHGPGPSVHSS